MNGLCAPGFRGQVLDAPSVPLRCRRIQQPKFVRRKLARAERLSLDMEPNAENPLHLRRGLAKLRPSTLRGPEGPEFLEAPTPSLSVRARPRVFLPAWQHRQRAAPVLLQRSGTFRTTLQREPLREPPIDWIGVATRRVPAVSLTESGKGVDVLPPAWPGRTRLVRRSVRYVLGHHVGVLRPLHANVPAHGLGHCVAENSDALHGQALPVHQIPLRMQRPAAPEHSPRIHDNRLGA